MKFTVSIMLVFALVSSATADEESVPANPDTTFRNALRVIEKRYVASMRRLAGNAAKIRIYRIGDEIEDPDLFGEYPEDRYFSIQEDGQQRVFKFSESFALKGNAQKIHEWASALLPAESHPFAMCVSTPSFAIRFLDGEGGTIYATTFCNRSQFAALEFPRYSDRIGIDLEATRKLLKQAGFIPDKLKNEQDAAMGNQRESE